MTLAMLAFLIDQAQHHCCPLFRKAQKHQERSLYLWNRMRSLIQTFVFPDWETLYLAIAGELGKEDCAGLVRAGPQTGPAPLERQPLIPPFAETPLSGQTPGAQPCAPETSRPQRARGTPPASRRPSYRELL